MKIIAAPEYENPLGNPYLRRGKAGAIGGFHRFKHIVNQATLVFSDAVNCYSAARENRVAPDANRQNHIN
jgi:hypothetical protein